MKIAQIAPLTESVPPKRYGGTERVVSYITEALVDLGHDVTLFASGDSQTRAKLEAVWPKALRADYSVRDRIAPHMLLLERVRQQADQFDVLHFHMDYYSFSLFGRQSTPFLTTLHGRLDLPEQQPVFNAFTHAPVVSISDSQRRPLPQADWRRTIHHGLPLNLLRPPASPQGGYLAFLGRISPEKGIDKAIAIASRCGLPIKIAAKIDAADNAYYTDVVAPLLAQPHVEFVGEIADRDKSQFLGNAVGVLLPVDWPEPFGLVMIESMACGTPVIGFNRGAVSEVIEDGLTGFVVEDELGAVAAINRLGSLDRRAIRARFEARFSAERMASDYVATYQELIRERRRSQFRLVETVGTESPGANLE